MARSQSPKSDLSKNKSNKKQIKIKKKTNLTSSQGKASGRKPLQKPVSKSQPVRRGVSPKKTGSKAGSRVNTITKIKDFVYRVDVGRRSQIYLLGTAHVSKRSVELVKATLNKYRPQTVYVELDAERKESLRGGDRFRELDVLKIIKENKVLYFIFYLFMGIIQKKIAEKYGTRPGGEFIAALEWADQHNREVVLIDRNAQTTVKRTWRSMGLGEQLRLLFSGFLSGDEIDDFDVEGMKEDDILSDLIKKMGLRFPRIKKILIDERDEYMTSEIIRHVGKVETQAGKKVLGVAVVGAGHLYGMREHLEESRIIDNRLLERMPPPHFFWKALPWAFSGIVFLVFLTGFWFTDWQTLWDAFLYWVMITGGLSALGTLLAGGHPLTAVAALIAAPITTLHPLLGVGVFTAAAQFYFSPPQIKDFENLSLKITDVFSWWRNRVCRILLVFLFSSLGAGIGMWIALSRVISVFA